MLYKCRQVAIMRWKQSNHLALLFVTLSLSVATTANPPLVSDGLVENESEDSSNSEQFFGIYFLNKDERQQIIVQKCCAPSQVLSEDGTCEQRNFQLRNLSLQQRIRRASQAHDEEPGINNDDGGTDDEAVEIGFLPRRPNCENGVRRQFSYSVHSSELRFTESMQYVANFLVDDDQDGGASNKSVMVDSRDYCIDWKTEDTLVIEFCLSTSCLPMLQQLPGTIPPFTSYQDNTDIPMPTITRSLCLQKCCPPSHMIDMKSFTCVKQSNPWQLMPLALGSINPNGERTSDTSTNSTLFGDGNNNNAAWHLPKNPLRASWVTGIPNCTHSYEVYTDEYERYYINSEGLLITEKLGTVAKTPSGEYCFDAVLQDDFNNSSVDSTENQSGAGYNAKIVSSDIPNFSRQIAIICFEAQEESGEVETEEDGQFSWRSVYTIFTGISCIFLLITCVVYAILRKELNLPGWLQFSYSFAMFITFSLLTVAQLWTQRIHDISSSLCRALGYSLHFSFLSCFFWLTSMNLDLFMSFRSSAIAHHGFGKSRGKRRFFEFTAFSIGFPAAITLLLFAVDCYYPDNANMKAPIWALPTSGIGKESCVIHLGNKGAQLHYFYGFVGILLFVNLVVFICTLISLRNRERETRMAKRQSTSSPDYDRNAWFTLGRLQLFTRLFLIMGILWIFEAISWTFEYFEVKGKITNIFIFTDCLNALQGIAVFVMFVWKKQTWKQLKKKFKSTFGIRGTRPLSRPSYNCTMSSNTGTTKSSSLKSNYFSSTKSTDSSSRIPSTTVTTVENDACCYQK